MAPDDQMEPRAPRKTLPRQAAERAILDAAEQVFGEAGYGRGSVQEIARVAGVAKPNVHYYFDTKDKLYRAVLERVVVSWLSAADDFDDAADPAEALAGYIGAKMDLSRARPAGSKLWAAEIMHGAPVVQDFLRTTLVAWMEARSAVVRRWQVAGLIGDVEPKNLFYMIWATTQHYADFAHQINALNGGAPMDDAGWSRAKTDVIGLILGGLGLTPPEG